MCRFPHLTCVETQDPFLTPSKPAPPCPTVIPQNPMDRLDAKFHDLASKTDLEECVKKTVNEGLEKLGDDLVSAATKIATRSEVVIAKKVANVLSKARRDNKRLRDENRVLRSMLKITGMKKNIALIKKDVAFIKDELMMLRGDFTDALEPPCGP